LRAAISVNSAWNFRIGKGRPKSSLTMVRYPQRCFRPKPSEGFVASSIFPGDQTAFLWPLATA
jgi:hypothetical protein